MADLSPNLAAFTAHCRWLISEGFDGVALLGTTGEANSFPSAERKAMLEAALAGGLRSDRLMRRGVANIPETVDLTRQALALGVTRVVILPPFYCKGVSDEWLVCRLCPHDRGDWRCSVAGRALPHPADVWHCHQP